MGYSFLELIFNPVLASVEESGISLLPPGIFKWAIGIGILMALGSIIYAGIVYMISAGNQSYQKEAIERIKGAVFGLILLMSGWLILYTLNPDILKSGTIKIPEIELKQDNNNQGQSIYEDKSTSQKKEALIIEGYPLKNPVPGSRVTSGFGWRRSPIARRERSIKKGDCRFHRGVDFGAKCGTRVYATRSGVVKLNTRDPLGYGNQVIITHAGGFTTSYSHLSKFAVKNGQQVNEGGHIGYVGRTGSSTGCHLHYEVRKNNKPVDINKIFGTKADGC